MFSVSPEWSGGGAKGDWEQEIGEKDVTRVGWSVLPCTLTLTLSLSLVCFFVLSSFAIVFLSFEKLVG